MIPQPLSARELPSTVRRSTNAEIAAITIRQRGNERLGSVENAMSNSHDEKMQYMSAYQAR
jgi:hypothetical protein